MSELSRKNTCYRYRMPKLFLNPLPRGCENGQFVIRPTFWGVSIYSYTQTLVRTFYEARGLDVSFRDQSEFSV